MQIVGYEPGTPTDPAVLLLAEAEQVESHVLKPGSELSFARGRRHCAGTIDDGTHEACESDSAPYCDVHTTIWPCARCRGNCSMPLDTCHEEHAIYLAGFEPATFKVGVTRSWRLQTRLAEQGARRGVHIRTVENGRKARQIEAEMASDIPDRVDLQRKIEGLDQTFDEAAWERLIEPHNPINRFEFDYGLTVDQQPIQATTAHGSIRGSRGRILLLQRGSTPYAVDLQSLVGYELSDDDPGENRQASLGGF